MRSLAIKFSKNSASLLPGREASGVVNSMQRLAVNFVTDSGSQLLIKDCGTNLRKDASSGSLGNFQNVQHAVNFACADTEYLLETYRPSNLPNSERLTNIQGFVVFLGEGTMRSHISAEDGSGNIVQEQIDY